MSKKQVRWGISWRYTAPCGPDGRAKPLWGSHTIQPVDGPEGDWDLDLQYWVNQVRSGKQVLRCGAGLEIRDVRINELDFIRVTKHVEEDVTDQYFKTGPR